MRKAFFIIIALTITNVFGQDLNKLPKQRYSVSFSISPMWQSTMMNFFNLEYINYTSPFCMPFSYEKNLQGLGLASSVSISSLDYKFGINYSAAGRYDYINHIFGTQRDAYEMIFNHNLSLIKELPTRKKRGALTHAFGVGYGIINTGKSFIYDNTCRGNPQERFNLQFPVYSFFYRLPIGKAFFIEPKANLTVDGHPINHKQQYIFYNLRLAYSLSTSW